MITSKSTIYPIILTALLILLTTPLTLSCVQEERAHTSVSKEIVTLPQPALDSDFSIEKALQSRRSVRIYKDEPLNLQTVSQILWSAQGITQEERGYRTAPSAGARFPLEVYVAIGNVEGISSGLYHYVPQEHHLVKIHQNDLRTELSAAALRQASVRNGAFVVIIAAVFERLTDRYGDRGVRYTHMEVGHASQNIHLQVESLGLGTVIIGSFDDEQMKKILNLPENQIPLYLMPIGKK